jgi:hypothetical protein
MTSFRDYQNELKVLIKEIKDKQLELEIKVNKIIENTTKI